MNTAMPRHNDEQREAEEIRNLNGTNGFGIELAVFRLFRPNGNQVFVGGKPVDAIQSKIAIQCGADDIVGHEAGRAYHHETAILIGLSGIVCPSSAQARTALSCSSDRPAERGRCSVPWWPRPRRKLKRAC